MKLELFMTALPAQVQLDKAPDGKTAMLRGLPVLREGIWNGRAYTAADLQALSDNFAEVQQADSWDPPLRPYHMLDADGKPIKIDARETLGWHKAITYDPTSKLLTADIEIVDADAIAALETGKLRYFSSEIYRNGYTSPVSGKVYDTPVYYGAAAVDNPAVKGMPWNLVINAEEYGHTQAEEKDGDRKMSWLETLKNVLRKEGVAEDDLAAVDQLAAGPPKPPDKQAASQPDPQLEQLTKTVTEQQAMIAQLQQTRRAEAVSGTVDALVKDGLVPPAMRLQCLALVNVLHGQAQPLEVLSADAEGKPVTKQATALELLQEILAATKPKLQAPSAGLWQGSQELDEQVESLSDERLDEIAAAAGGTPKKGA